MRVTTTCDKQQRFGVYRAGYSRRNLRLRIRPGYFGIMEVPFETYMPGSGSSFEAVAQGRFPPTHWTMVMSAGKDSSPDARQAFGVLYQKYLPPLMAFLRSRGATEDQAQELTQEFFESLLQRGSLGMVNRTGKFRNWLLTCIKNFLSDRWDRQSAGKRGGGREHVAVGSAGEENAVEPTHPGRTPDEEYERQYALTFLQDVIQLLEHEYTARDRKEIFVELRPFLQEKKAGISHAELGRKLGMIENTVTSEISKLRKRFRTIFDQELEKLVSSREEVEEEKRFLFAALSR